VMGREFLTVWVGAKFKDPAIIHSMATVLAILTAGYLFILSQHSNFLVLAGRGEHKVFGILTAVEAVLCVSSAVFSVKVLGWGLEGIAWSNFVPMTIVAGIVLPIYFNRKMRIPAWDSIRHVWWPALLGSVPGVAIVVSWKYLSPPDSWREILAVVGVTGAATLVFGWFLSLEGTERQRLIRVFHRGRGKPAEQNAQVPARG